MGSNMLETLGTTGRTKTIRRQVPAVDAELAEMLGRPAEAHTLIEVWEEVRVLMSPHYEGPPEQLQWRLQRQEREGLDAADDNNKEAT